VTDNTLDASERIIARLRHLADTADDPRSRGCYLYAIEIIEREFGRLPDGTGALVNQAPAGLGRPGFDPLSQGKG
jgi:hypothetical protein